MDWKEIKKYKEGITQDGWFTAANPAFNMPEPFEKCEGKIYKGVYIVYNYGRSG